MPGAVLGVANSAWLRSLCDLEPRARELILLVKTWAGRRGLKDAAAGHLSSYAHSLTVVHYALASSPPLLVDVIDPSADAPTAATAAPLRRAVMVKGFNVDFCRDAALCAARLREARGTAPLPGLGRLALGFFEYMARAATDPSRAGVSLAVRTRRHPPGSALGAFEHSKSQWKTSSGRAPADDHPIFERLSIEDPFETVDSVAPHDLGRTLNAKNARLLGREYKRAAALLRRAVNAKDARTMSAAVEALLTAQ